MAEDCVCSFSALLHSIETVKFHAKPRRNMMQTQTQKVVLITGASSGIGEATAKVLAQAGHAVMLGARRTDRLQSLARSMTDAGGAAGFQGLDVTSRAEGQRFVSEALSIFGHIDVLIDNAGVMPLASMSALKIDEWDRLIDVNI